MYNNPYMSYYNPQSNIDKLNEQINNLEKMKAQMQQNAVQQPVPNVTQNFQLAPTNRDVIKYAASIDEVQRDMVIGDTPYFSKDMSVVWIKNTKGEIKTYELTEIVPKDEKDILIEKLQSQINSLSNQIKEMNYNEQHYAKSNDESGDEYESEQLIEPVKSSKSSNVSSNRTSKSKSK